MVIARRVAILGATKGMGRALARACAARNEQLCLLGRDLAELARSVSDLQARGATAAAFAYCDLADPATFAGALEAAVARLGGLDVIIVKAAAFATQAQLDADPARVKALLTVDFTNTVLFCEAARRILLSSGSANPTLCVFSSVAGERGRKPVILYGAAKAGLTRYLEAIDHAFHADGLRVVCVKPGFVRTSMTEGLPVPPFAGDPDAVATRVLTAIDRGTPVVYAPSIWAVIMAVIRLLPRSVMRRIDF